jgi:uncharacterized Zn-binding protein involved in type VI secretion
MGEPAARLTDMHLCPMWDGDDPHVGGPIIDPGAPTVYIGGLIAARVGDTAICNGPPDVIVEGSPTVFIGGQMAARLGDGTAHGGVIVEGDPTVLIGEGAGGGDEDGGACEDDEGDDASDDDDDDILDLTDDDKSLVSLEISHTWLNESTASKTIGDSDNNIKFLASQTVVRGALEYDPLKGKIDLTADASKSFALMTATDKQVHQLGDGITATTTEKAVIGEVKASGKLSAAYSDGTASLDASLGVSAMLVQDSASGEVKITGARIYDETIGRLTSAPAPSWLGKVALVASGEGQAGVGASATASATGEIGKDGASLALSGKLAWGVGLGLNAKIGIIW